MPAFMIFHATITDPNAFQEYASSAPITLEPYEGKLITKGKVEKVLSGDHTHNNVGILQFPDLEKAHQWYASKAYQNLLPLRNRGANMTVISYQAKS